MARQQGAFTTEVTGEEKIRGNIARLRKALPEALALCNEQTADEMVAEAQHNLRAHDAIVTGDLYNSIDARASASGLQVIVGTTSEHGPWVEFGTRPHWPPIDAIRAWCRLRGIPEKAAYPIAKKISERGTPEQPFLYPAYVTGQKRHLQRVRTVLAAVLQGLGL
jgi:hypothetical protein